MSCDVSLVRCTDYEIDHMRQALPRLLEPLGGLSWVTPGMKIVIKANLVSGKPPEDAVTTHPALLCVLTEMLKAKGAASVVIGDSPGGVYNAAYLNRIYQKCGITAAEQYGAVLNQNFGITEVHFPEAAVAHEFKYTAYLDDADAVINCCKLKTHGMMGMTCAVKNMYGMVPGSVKSEYHYRYSDPMDFARMIIDLNRAKPARLHIVDAVVGMEGNGPTMGTPRPLGLLLADDNPYRLDTACAALIGEDPAALPALSAARARGLLPEDTPLPKEMTPFLRPDWNRPPRRDIRFVRGTPLSPVLTFLLQSRPKVLPAQCVGCGKCARVCPAKAIRMQRHRPSIDRKACIRCFCCQEFCPKGAMISHRSAIARLLTP